MRKEDPTRAEINSDGAARIYEAWSRVVKSQMSLDPAISHWIIAATARQDRKKMLTVYMARSIARCFNGVATRRSGIVKPATANRWGKIIHAEMQANEAFSKAVRRWIETIREQIEASNAVEPWQPPTVEATINEAVVGYDIDDIDEGIRSFISAMNSYPGVTTEHSCAGHDQGYWDTGYVTFYVTTLEVLNKLIRTLPNGGSEAAGRGHVAWWWCEADANKPGDTRLRFTIRSLIAPEKIRNLFWTEMANAIVQKNAITHKTGAE